MSEDVWEGLPASNEFEIPDDIYLNGHGETRKFERTDLAHLAREGIPDPELLCQSLLYAGGLHSVAGPPDCGKSTFICWTALQIIKAGGQYVLMDEESGPYQYAEKLIALGATAADLGNLHYYDFPGMTWNMSETLQLINLVEEIKPKIIAWDSSAAFLARAGMDENSASDVTKFWSQVLTPCARGAGAAVLVADHVTKTITESRYARGSGAKLAATDCAYRMDAITPFSRTQPGNLKLTVSKDRRGWLHRWHEIGVIPHNAGARLEFDVRPTQPVLADNAPPLQQALMKVLSTQPESRSYLMNLVTREMHARPARESVSRALNELADKGLVTRFDQGQGKEAYWSLAAPTPKPPAKPPKPEPPAPEPPTGLFPADL